MTVNDMTKLLPFKLRMKMRQGLVGMLGETVSKGWENYARRFKAAPGNHLGDEWNEPEVYGIDVPPDQIVPTLDRTVFAPFLGTPDVILEIGPGGGRLTQILLPKCRKVLAADTSPTMLSMLKERFPASPRLEPVLLNGRGLDPIRDDTVDAAFSFDVFVHLEPWDIFNYLCEIKRVLKPGGKALIHHSNTFSDLGWKRFVGDTAQQVNVPKVWGTLSFMTPEVFKELSERAGLRYLGCDVDSVRRDCISFLERPAG